MATTADRTVYWLPRLLSIAFILFLSLGIATPSVRAIM
jgi:hypothetical protein